MSEDDLLTGNAAAIHRQERLGYALIMDKKFAEAAEVFARLRLDDPPNTTALRGLVDAHFHLRHIDQAIALQRELVNLEPANAAARDWLAALLLRTGQVSSALTEVEVGLGFHPTHGGLLHRRSEIAHKVEDPSAAVGWAHKALEAEPQSLFRAEWLGHVLVRAGDLDAAAAQFYHVLAHDLRHSGARRGMINVYRQRGDIAQAVRLQRNLIAESPTDADLHVTLAAMLLQADDVPAARLAMDAALAVLPGHDALVQCQRHVTRREAMNNTWEPLAREVEPESNWMQLHQTLARNVHALNPRFLFLGDSIIAEWCIENKGRPVWDAWFVPLRAGNLGVAGDKTQAVLWRLRHGAVADITPEGVVVLIGTNNINDTSPANVARGVVAVVQEIGRALPQTRILLLGILPRGSNPNDPVRAKVRAVNATLREDAATRSVAFLDLESVLLEPDGTLAAEVAPDALHFSLRGYLLMAPSIASALNATPSKPPPAAW